MVLESYEIVYTAFYEWIPIAILIILYIGNGQ